MRKLVLFSTLFLSTLVLYAQISMQKSDDGILITEHNENVLFYQIENKSLNGAYERCNYIHPLWGLDGAILTEDFPADHLHHRGIFWAWHQILIDGKPIGDGWEIKDFKQEVIDVEFISTDNRKAVLNTEVDWKSDLWKNGTPYLKENTTITIHQKKSDYRKIDFEIKLLAQVENLRIGGSEDEKGYSGFSVRMKLPENVKFSGPDGEVQSEINAVQSNGFINISCSVKENIKKGIVIIDNKNNPDYPQKWILRAKNSMQNAAYPGREAVSISSSEPLLLKYSLLIYSGNIDNKLIAKIIN